MKKGFTLIELLAVIIILAIIALIATPIVLNVVEDVRIKARESSVLQYADGVKLAYAEEMLKNTGRPLKELADEKMSGEEVNCEVVAYSETQGVILSGCTVGKDDTKYYYLKELSTEKSAELIAYLGDTACVKATTTTYGVLATDDNPYVVGGEYNCTLGDGQTRTFFVLEEGTDTVSLIMDRNIGNSAWVTLEDYKNAENRTSDTVSFCSVNDIDKIGCVDLGPITAINTLNNLTSGWNDVEVSLPNKDTIISSKIEETWTEDGVTHIKVSYPEWLYSNLNKHQYDDSTFTDAAYHVYYIGETVQEDNIDGLSSWGVQVMSFGSFGISVEDFDGDEPAGGETVIDTATEIGIRPVITISKTLMR